MLLSTHGILPSNKKSEKSNEQKPFLPDNFRNNKTIVRTTFLLGQVKPLTKFS